MRNKRALIMIAVSVLMGLMAVIVAAQWLGRRAMLPTNKVVVATRDIPIGSPLVADMLRAVDWPAGHLPDGVIPDPKALEARVVRTNVQRGEPLLENRLAPKGTKGGLSSVISEGKRAVTVKVNEVIGVAGFALPGNLVDVMVNAKDDTGRPISKIVLEQILVLAIAQEANRDETKPKVVSAVTLELSPEQAERLDLARSIGTLSLVLRNQLDKTPTATTGARSMDLLSTARVQPKAGKSPPKSVRVEAKPRLEMIKGIHKSSVEF
jgi:pilus assembly protein CpaB